jgi:hypothetical protein
MTAKAITELSDRQLRRRQERAERAFEKLYSTDDSDVVRAGRADQHLRALEFAVQELATVRGERQRREERDNASSLVNRLRREETANPASATGVFTYIRARAHPELVGENFDASRLSDEEGEELKALVERQVAILEDAGNRHEPLTGAEISRYEELVGIACGDRELFQGKRQERAAQERTRAIREKRRRHPRAESLVAAIIGDPGLFDDLHQRIREDVRVFDEYGREKTGVSTERILELEHISSLFALVNLILANGGGAISLNRFGALEVTGRDGVLPFIPVETFGQLHRNGYLDVMVLGSNYIIGIGPRARRIAERWGIELPEPEQRRPEAASA